jgi:hypothetical protein
MSGYEHDSGMAEVAQKQNIRLIQKPFAPGTLLQAVRETLDRSMRAPAPQGLDAP